MELEELLERIEPIGFDDYTPKSNFLQTLDKFPEFKETLKDEILLDENQEWVEKAQKEKFYFIINDDSWKKTKSSFPNSIRLNFVGMRNIPVISIDIHHN